MSKKKLNVKQYAELLFSKNKSLLKDLRVTNEAPPLALVSASSLAVFRLLPQIMKITAIKNGSKLLEEILIEYERLLKRWYLGENIAFIKTATPLTIKEEEELNEKIAEIFGRYFRLEIEVNPDLIGGIIIKVGDKIIDRSIAGKLKKLEEHIKS